MVLAEKNLPYRCIEEDLKNFSPELKALHPEAKVPLLIHELDGHKNVIFQSTVITEYLDEAFSSSPQLMPSTPFLRAEVRLWTYWCDAVFKPDLDAYKYKLHSLADDDAETLRARLHKHFVRWESAFLTGAQNFLVSPNLTLADIHLFPFARQFLACKPPLSGMESYSRLLDWMKHMEDGPAFKKAVQG